MIKPRVSGEFLVCSSRAFVCTFSQDILKEVCKVRYRFFYWSRIDSGGEFNKFGFEASSVQFCCYFLFDFL